MPSAASCPPPLPVTMPAAAACPQPLLVAPRWCKVAELLVVFDEKQVNVLIEYKTGTGLWMADPEDPSNESERFYYVKMPAAHKHEDRWGYFTRAADKYGIEAESIMKNIGVQKEHFVAQIGCIAQEHLEGLADNMAKACFDDVKQQS